METTLAMVPNGGWVLLPHPFDERDHLRRGLELGKGGELLLQFAVGPKAMYLVVTWPADVDYIALGPPLKLLPGDEMMLLQRQVIPPT